MVMVATLDSFPAGVITRDFYSGTTPDSEFEDSGGAKKRKDRIRKRVARTKAREERASMPADVAALYRRNKGDV
jgi:hypothetical protein